MATTKKRTTQHIIDSEAQKLLEAALPKSWVLRPYQPDYGLDYALEIFKEDDTGAFPTLGEHLFIQLKGVQKTKTITLQFKERYNVEKTPLTESDELAGEVEVIPFSLETSELLTVQRMGAAVPVLLVIGALDTGTCHFVCLNDYVDKILVPKHKGAYDAKESRTIHVPLRNNLADERIGVTAFRWYGKRAKLYAAFQKFIYQQVELDYAWNKIGYSDMAEHFASLIVGYDFWDDTEMWDIISYYATAVRHFESHGVPSFMKIDDDAIKSVAMDTGQDVDDLREIARMQAIASMWRGLSVLPRNYEEICREWYLPTALGLVTSY